MNVSNLVKNEYRGNSIHKNLRLYFPDLDLTITNEQIYQESMSLQESLMKGSTVEFVGCIASCFKIKVNGIKENLKNERIVVTIWTDLTENEPIVLFRGKVDSAKGESNKRIKNIIAYDELYYISDIDVASWYKNLTFPITLKNLRNSLFTRLEITQVTTNLPNDNVSISKQYDPNNLNALTVIKSICQINGAFGIINREGNFEYRVPAWSINVTPYPSTTLFPGNDLYPGTNVQTRSGGGTVEAESFAFYRKVDYEEFAVKPVDKVTVRQDYDDAGVVYGSGQNNYIVQNNMFTRGLDSSVLQTIARGIYNSVSGIAYTPFTSSNNGLPWLECGIDAVAYKVYNYNYEPTGSRGPISADVDTNSRFIDKTFYVINRTMTGIQALKDSYNAEGDEEQKEFVTDLNANIDTIKDKQEDTYSKEEIDTTFEDYDTQFEDFSDQIETINDNMPVLVKVSVLPSIQEQQAHPNYWYFLVRS